MATYRGGPGRDRKMDPSPPVGRTGPKAVTFAPWWIDGRKQCSQRRASHHGEFWEDVYASWVRYKLKLPLEGGGLHQEDTSRMKALWGHMLDIQ